MNQRKIATVIAVGFFLFWLGILYAGADHPPPPGFILIVMLDLGCALLVYYRARTYIIWAETQNIHRWFRVILDGLAAGLFVALITIIFPHNSESGIQQSILDYGIWFAVLGLVGTFNAVVIYSLCKLLFRMIGKKGENK